MEKRKKTRVHTLTEHEIKNRSRNSIRLYRSICGHRTQFSVTLDEAMFFFIPGQHSSDVFFVRKGEEIPENYVKQVREVQAPHVMVVAGMTGRGPLKARIVLPKTKINADYYIKKVLRPIIEKELPSLYPDDMDKLFVHHDKAPSHMANRTFDFLAEMKQKYGISFQVKEDIAVKGADCSPMDFFAFGWLKSKIKETKANTLKASAEASQDVGQNSLSKHVLMCSKPGKLGVVRFMRSRGSILNRSKPFIEKDVNIVSTIKLLQP